MWNRCCVGAGRYSSGAIFHLERTGDISLSALAEEELLVSGRCTLSLPTSAFSHGPERAFSKSYQYSLIVFID